MSEEPRVDENRRPLPPLPGIEDRFRFFFDAVADGIFISNPATGRFIEINQPGCRMFGYAKSELIGRDIGTLSSGAHPYTQEAAIAWLEKARLKGPQTFEWHCKTKDGVLFWAESRSAIRSLTISTPPWPSCATSPSIGGRKKC